MSFEDDPEDPIIHSRRLRLVPMKPELLEALIDLDFGRAASLSGFLGMEKWEGRKDAMAFRLEQLQKDPEAAKKLACTVVTVVFLLLAAMVLLGEGIIWGYYRFFSILPSTNFKLALSGIMLPYTI